MKPLDAIAKLADSHDDPNTQSSDLVAAPLACRTASHSTTGGEDVGHALKDIIRTLEVRERQRLEARRYLQQYISSNSQEGPDIGIELEVLFQRQAEAFEDKLCAAALEQEEVVAARNTADAKKAALYDRAIEQRDQAVKERDEANQARDAAIEAREAALTESEVIKLEKHGVALAAVKEKRDRKNQAKKLQDQGNAQRDIFKEELEKWSSWAKESEQALGELRKEHAELQKEHAELQAILGQRSTSDNRAAVKRARSPSEPEISQDPYRRGLCSQTSRDGADTAVDFTEVEVSEDARPVVSRAEAGSPVLPQVKSDQGHCRDSG